MKSNKLIGVLAAGYLLGCALFAFSQTNYADGITVGSSGSYGISSAGVVTASSIAGAVTGSGSSSFTTATVSNSLTVGTGGTAIAKILYGSGTVASGATTATISLTGCTSAATALGTITNDTTNACYIEYLIPGTNSLAVKVNTDPGSGGATIDVFVIR